MDDRFDIPDEALITDDDSEALEHYGMPRRSGRYPWGSGDNPYQHEGYFEKRYKELKDAGYSEKEISKAMGMSIADIRAAYSVIVNEKKASDIAQAKRYREHGYSATEIGRKMGVSESTVRGWLKADETKAQNQDKELADRIKALVDEGKYVDIGQGVDRMLGVSPQRLKNAVAILKSQGYEVQEAYEPQVVNYRQNTTIKVICPPGTTKADVAQNRFEKVAELDISSTDGGETYKAWHRPVSVDSSRIYIRYGDQGGKDMDGVIELRRGVPDLDMGESSYAQCRIGVDGTHYLKGMAIYSKDIPDGFDIVYNTNKPSGTDKYKVFKEMSSDPDNPFKSLLRKDGQRWYTDPETGEQKLSVINKVRQEGDWEDWKKSLASQFLAKQPMKLIEQQLSLSYADKAAELDILENLTNPVVKRNLLESFADDCDAAAVHLKAAPLPGQKMQVILPIKTLKDNEVYAPNFKNGTKVALIRYPHGGTFEIPILKVNNKHEDSIDILGQATDAVGINSKVAERLSGADFDGDTVMVIPITPTANIVSTPSLEGLKDFDPKTEYPGYEGMEVLTKKNTQTEMGKVSNLITDMTLKGANEEELARAVRHSMVVIDANKHKLDYKRSFRENRIAELKTLYQGGPNAGASTLISAAKSQYRVNERTEGIYITDPKTGATRKQYIDPETGEKLYTETGRMLREKSGETYIGKDGKEHDIYITSNRPAQEVSTKMAETKDAFTLSSGTPQEDAYAAYANSLKQLANRARLDILNTGRQEYSPTAYNTYRSEVSSLVGKLNESLKNAPRERMAQTLANQKLKAWKEDSPELFEDKDDEKKYAQKALTEARSEVGAQRVPINITEREWEAIQAGAVSENRLSMIIPRVDDGVLKKLAMPRNTPGLSDAQVTRIKAMNAAGYTASEIAEQMGISNSTVLDKLKD